MQKGESAAVVEARKREAEARRAQASRNDKVFFKVTVKACRWRRFLPFVATVRWRFAFLAAHVSNKFQLEKTLHCGMAIPCFKLTHSPCMLQVPISHLLPFRTTAWAWPTRTSPTCWAAC